LTVAAEPALRYSRSKELISGSTRCEGLFSKTSSRHILHCPTGLILFHPSAFKSTHRVGTVIEREGEFPRLKSAPIAEPCRAPNASLYAPRQSRSERGSQLDELP